MAVVYIHRVEKVKVKVNRSRYRPGQAQMVPGSKGKAVPLQAWRGPRVPGSKGKAVPLQAWTGPDGSRK